MQTPEQLIGTLLVKNLSRNFQNAQRQKQRASELLQEWLDNIEEIELTDEVRETLYQYLLDGCTNSTVTSALRFAPGYIQQEVFRFRGVPELWHIETLHAELMKIEDAAERAARAVGMLSIGGLWSTVDVFGVEKDDIQELLGIQPVSFL